MKMDYEYFWIKMQKIWNIFGGTLEKRDQTTISKILNQIARDQRDADVEKIKNLRLLIGESWREKAVAALREEE